jgi:hypothetical protein
LLFVREHFQRYANLPLLFHHPLSLFTRLNLESLQELFVQPVLC